MSLLEPLQLLPGSRVRWRGRTLDYFSGCDYFRLASHPAVLRAARQGLQHFGLNVAASRLTTGHHVLYDQLEAALAKFFNAPAALLVSSGYATSTVVAQALTGEVTHALFDERAHPALRDAALHFGCPVITFKHRDPADLARAAARCGRQARLMILTDGLFSHDGSVAPLRAYLKVLPASARLLVDDAHGAGVLGKNGRGTLELERVSRRRIVQCVTLSKAFGAYGGAVLGSRALRQRILQRSRAFIGCTPLPLPLANAALTGLNLLAHDPQRRTRLHASTSYVKDRLRSLGFSFAAQPGPMVALAARSTAEIRRWRRHLLAAGIYPPLLRYTGAPAGCFRFVISSEHSPAQLSRLVKAMTPLARRQPDAPPQGPAGGAAARPAR